MIYLASPYSDPDAAVRQRRYEAALTFTKQHLRSGVPIFSPILYGHHLNLGTSFQQWLPFNMAILRRCEKLFLLRLEGWKESRGCAFELRVAGFLQIPIFRFSAEGTLLDEDYSDGQLEAGQP